MHTRLILLLSYFVMVVFMFISSPFATFAIGPCKGLSGTECMLNCNSGDADLVCSSTEKKCSASCGTNSRDPKRNAIQIIKNTSLDVSIVTSWSIDPENFINILKKKYIDGEGFKAKPIANNILLIRDEYIFKNNQRVEVLIGFQRSTLEFLNEQIRNKRFDVFDTAIRELK